MMEENNRKGPGVFYAVMGVATLVVAIIGATFAYFSATTDADTETIGGQTASAASIELDVQQVYPTSGDLKSTNGRIIPLESGEENAENADPAFSTETQMATALASDCVSKGYVACQVYSVNVKNGGSDPVKATPMIKLNYEAVVSENGEETVTRTFTNLRWQKLNATAGEGTTSFALDNGFDAVKNHETATPLGTMEGLTNAVVDGETMYFVVWLEETGVAQDETGLTFGGSVELQVFDANNNALEAKLTSTF